MSRLEKALVNRSGDRRSKSVLSLIDKSVEMPDSASTLEIGAGTGSLSLRLYQEFNPSKLEVTDYDQSQVEAAKRRFAAALGPEPSGVEFRVADAIALPFEDASFDSVFAINVLHHVGEHGMAMEGVSKAIDEIWRVLKPHGYFVYQEIFHKNSVRNLLNRRGFRKVSVKRYLFFRDLGVYQKPAHENV